jgi:hypothetical protein
MTFSPDLADNETIWYCFQIYHSLGGSLIVLGYIEARKGKLVGKEHACWK